MAIVSVMQGLVETEDGEVFELDFSKGAKWLETATSFRYEPIGANKGYTVRKEAKKGGDYWYGYRKVDGTLHKRYIGKSSELTTAKLEEIAEALNTPQQSRVTQTVTEAVTHKPEDNDLAALKLRVQALEESLKTLQGEQLGNSEENATPTPPEPETVVTENGLLIKLSNLRAENEALRQELAKQKDDYAAQLAISKVFHQQAQDLQSQFETVRAELEACRKQTAVEVEPLEAADLLNRLKAKRKKSSTSLADIEALLEILEES